MQSIFTFLTRAVEGPPGIALFASFVWGILSILLSPCHLASIPLIVGFIGTQGKITTKTAFKLAMVFSIGIFITIGTVGIVTALLGRMAGDIGKWGNYLVGIIFIGVGFYLLDVIKFSGLKGLNQPVLKQKGSFAALILGIIFGVAVGPCTFAYMAPILAATFQMSGKRFIYSIFFFLTFAAGHCSVIVLAGTLTEFVQSYLSWSEKTKFSLWIKRICGILIILAGLYMLVKM